MSKTCGRGVRIDESGRPGSRQNMMYIGKRYYSHLFQAAESSRDGGYFCASQAFLRHPTCGVDGREVRVLNLLMSGLAAWLIQHGPSHGVAGRAPGPLCCDVDVISKQIIWSKTASRCPRCFAGRTSRWWLFISVSHYFHDKSYCSTCLFSYPSMYASRDQRGCTGYIPVEMSGRGRGHNTNMMPFDH